MSQPYRYATKIDTPLRFFDFFFRDRQILKVLKEVDIDEEWWVNQDSPTNVFAKCLAIVLDHEDHILPPEFLSPPTTLLQQEDYYILKPDAPVSKDTLKLVRRIADVLREDMRYYELLMAMTRMFDKIKAPNFILASRGDIFPSYAELSDIMKNLIMLRRLFLQPKLGIRFLEKGVLNFQENITFLVERIQDYLREAFPHYPHILTEDAITNTCATLYSLGFPYKVDGEWILEASNRPQSVYVGEIHTTLECLAVRTHSGVKLITHSGHIVRQRPYQEDESLEDTHGETLVSGTILRLPTLISWLLPGRLYAACMEYDGGLRPEFIKGRWRIVAYPHSIRQFRPNQGEGIGHTVPNDKNHYVREFNRLKSYGVVVILQEDLQQVRGVNGGSVMLPMIYIDPEGLVTILNHHRLYAAEYLNMPIEVMVMEDPNILHML